MDNSAPFHSLISYLMESIPYEDPVKAFLNIQTNQSVKPGGCFLLLSPMEKRKSCYVTRIKGPVRILYF